jgi:hypothetical protein
VSGGLDAGQVSAERGGPAPAIPAWGGAGEGIEVEFFPTLEDKLGATRAIHGSPLGRLFDVAFPLLMLVNALLVVMQGGWRALFSGFAWVFPLLIACWALSRPFGRWLAARSWRADPGQQGRHRLRLGERGLELENTQQTVRLAWEAIQRAEEKGGFFLLYFGRKAAYYLPRRALDAAGEARVRALLRRHLGERAPLAPHAGA